MTVSSALARVANNIIDEPDIDDVASTSKFRLSRAINLCLFLTTGIGLCAAVVVTIVFFDPDWIENYRQQLFPNRTPQAALNR